MKAKLISLVFMLAVCPCLLAENKKPGLYSPGMKPVEISTLKPLSESDAVVSGALYSDSSLPSDTRVRDLISRMTFDEKLDLTGGWNRFLVSGVPRLGVRPVSMADASQGLRLQTTVIKDPSVSYPGMLPLASTWNVELASAMAVQIADECRAHGVDILLGPGLNIQRLSVGGRGYEYFGEDPFLTAEMGSAYIKSLQNGGVIACPKHFIANDQDFCRHITNYIISERTLREIYLLPWEKAICDAGALGIMTGNNLVNGYHCFMNRNLLTEILRNDYGYKGLVMTDWQNTNYFPSLQHLVLQSGGTLMMPENNMFRGAVTKMLEENPDSRQEVESMLDDMIYPTFYALFEMGVYDRPLCVQPEVGSRETMKKLARQCAEEAVVLLKNEGNILPLRRRKNILLMGKEESSSGTGSGFVTGYDHVSIADGLKSEYGDRLTVDYDADDFQVRKADVVLFSINKPAGEGYDVPFEEPVSQLERLREVTKINKNVIVLVNACNSLPMDWLDDVKGVIWCYFLGQERGSAIASLLSGEENFSGKLPITLEKSFADSPDPDFNLLGGVPYWKGNNQYKEYWLGRNLEKKVPGFSDHVKPHEILDRPYEEGVFIGYRWADKTDMPCYFKFGEGLSYTTFEYDEIQTCNALDTSGIVEVTVKLKNTGKHAGKEVVQLYVSELNPEVERPMKELKAFDKVYLKPGDSITVTFRLGKRAFQYWDEQNHRWKIGSNEFEIAVGGSSADLPLRVKVTVNEES